MITKNSNANSVESVLGVHFSADELRLIAKVCSLDSMSIAFKWSEIVAIESVDGFLNIYFENQGKWMVELSTFKGMIELANEAIELEDQFNEAVEDLCGDESEICELDEDGAIELCEVEIIDYDNETTYSLFCLDPYGDLLKLQLEMTEFDEQMESMVLAEELDYDLESMTVWHTQDSQEAA